MPPKKMLYDKRLQKIENLVSSGIIQRDSWHDSLVWAVNEGRLSFAQITEIEQLGREARSMLLNLSYDDRAKAVSDVKKGKIDFKVEKNGIIHASVAKVSFDAKKISENAKELLQTIIKLKPSAAKGIYMKSVYMSSTMGLGIEVDTNSLV